MTGLLAIAALAAALAVYGVTRTGHRRVHSQGAGFLHGLLVIAWRWHTGMPWTGAALTDASWDRPGSRALTKTGHARKFWHLPRRRRALSRTARSAAIAAAVWGLATHPRVTLGVLAAAALAGLVLAAVAAVRAARHRRHRRTWLEPVHAAIAPLAGHPLALAPSDWLVIAPDRSKAELTLPAGATYTPAQRKELVLATAERLGIEAPDPGWQLRGPSHVLVIERTARPPDLVILADIAAAVERSAPAELVLGLGPRQAAVSASLALDSPHWGVSAESGAGKSVTCRLIMAQHMHKGGIAAVLDYKRFSHQWCKGLPNVAYARDPGECHDLLLWLQAEVDRRNRVADISADHEGNVHARFTRVMVVGEELNALVPRLKSHWAAIRGPGGPARSPALDALEELGFLGRQVSVNLLLVGQRLSVRATSGDLRENLGVKILSNPSSAAWKMLAPRFPQPPPDNHKGRAYVITDIVREVQIGYLKAAEAREHATSGILTPCPAGMPYVTLPAETPAPALAGRGPDLRVNHVSGPDGPVPVSPLDEMVTLRQAVTAGLVSSIGLAGLRTARHRGQLPASAGYQGGAQVWRVADLIDWSDSRRRT